MRAIRCNDLYHNVGDAMQSRSVLSIAASTMTLSMAGTPLMEIHISSQRYLIAYSCNFILSLFLTFRLTWGMVRSHTALFWVWSNWKDLCNFIKTSPWRPYGCFVRTVTCWVLEYCYSSTVGEALVGSTDIFEGFALLGPFGTHQNCSYFRIYFLK